MKHAWPFALTLCLTVVSNGTFVYAADKKACLSAYEKAQTLRKEGKLKAAREEALMCAQDGCPAALRDDCTSWAVELEKATPTLVIVALGPDDEDLSDVEVMLDGERVADKLDGKALPVEVGAHKLKLTWAKSKDSPIEQTVVMREGERARSVKVKFKPKFGEKKKDEVVTEKPPVKDKEVPAASSTPVSVWVLGGAGLLGLGIFGTFGAMGLSGKGSLDDKGCKPACSKSEVDKVKSNFLIADIGLGVGVVSLGIAAVLLVSSGPSTPSKDTPSVSFSPLRGGGYGAVGWSF